MIKELDVPRIDNIMKICIEKNKAEAIKALENLKIST